MPINGGVIIEQGEALSPLGGKQRATGPHHGPLPRCSGGFLGRRAGWLWPGILVTWVQGQVAHHFVLRELSLLGSGGIVDERLRGRAWERCGSDDMGAAAWERLRC